MREQLYVLICGNRDLNNITFVVNQNKALEKIRVFLGKKVNGHQLMYSFTLLMIFMQKKTREIDLGLAAPLSPKHIELPKTSTGYCYLLQRPNQFSLFYVGSTSRLKRRLTEHNSG